MGLSSDARIDSRNHKGREPEEADDVEALHALISPLSGDDGERTARQLLDRHGSLAALLLHFADTNASWGDINFLAEQHLIRLARAFFRSLRTEAFTQLRLSSTAALFTYLELEMRNLTYEVFRVIFLDSAGTLLADDTLWTGTINEVQIHPREVVKRALEVGASAIILAHNHPAGNAEPSLSDIQVTEQMAAACSTLEIEVRDHVIVGRKGYFSMRSQGLIGTANGFKDEFMQC